jgi:hypothetical protein
MGEDKKPKPQTCGTCNGQGGWWDHGNGKPGSKPKKWIKCQSCQGKGVR